jgi:hypothetical protein
MTLTPKEMTPGYKATIAKGTNALAACRVCGSAPAVLSIAPGVHVYADGGHHIID